MCRASSRSPPTPTAERTSPSRAATTRSRRRSTACSLNSSRPSWRSSQASGRVVPRFVERELRAYLEFGLLQFGFLPIRCEACGHDRLVAFSCKGRGFCPSCVGRRMADTAAHLVDRVLPEVPVRQWVLSLPWALRYRLAYDRRLCSDVLGLFIRTVFGALRRRARDLYPTHAHKPDCGAVTFVQRFGDALNLNLHFHTLVLDGVYLGNKRGEIRFHPLPPPSDGEIERITVILARRLQRLLERRGFFEAEVPSPDLCALESSGLPDIADASVRGRIATGPHAGQRVLRRGDRIDVEDVRHSPRSRCANIGGVSLHANVAVPAHDRKRLERLCRYVARPPIATERLSLLPDRRLLYRLKHRWRDGTTHVVFERLELIEKIVALIPPPRAHLVRYHGVLAPAARQRARVVSDRREPTAAVAAAAATALPTSLSAPPASAVASPPRRSPTIGQAARTRTALSAPDPTSTLRARRLSWSELMRRVFLVDLLKCPRCQGRMRILAAIVQPETIARILNQRGLSARAPPTQPPDPELLQASTPDLP